MTPSNPDRDGRQMVEALLAQACRRGASDIHLEPTRDGYEVRLRVDGLLEPLALHDAVAGRAMVARLMVMAQLLTYRLDVPQEGRARAVVPGDGQAEGETEGAANPKADPRALDLRVAVIPTTHGLRAAVRLPAELTMPTALADLGLPAAALAGLEAFARGHAGMLVVTGPAGSGKTTTLYALLRHIAATSPGTSVISLEDPVERELPGVTQIEVRPFGELTYEKALRSILRQDPQVLMLGEIRDAAVATLAVQAALSGHRLLSTLHAATPATALARLAEMGLEPYQLTSALYGVMAQRLLRKLAPAGAGPQAEQGKQPEQGGQAGQAGQGGRRYRGRVPVAEFAGMDPALRRALLARSDAQAMDQVIRARPAHETLRQSARHLVDSGVTDEAEAARVLGTGES